MATILLKNANLFGIKKNILISDNIIQSITESTPTSDKIIDLKNNVVLPGIIDTHVHFRDLKQSDKEDWGTASRAALNGGITTVFDMPNNTPACVNVENFKIKLDIVKKYKIDARFYAGVRKNKLPELIELLKTYRESIIGVKLFLAGSSNNELFDNREHLIELFKIASSFDLPVCVHSERQSTINHWEDTTKEKTIFSHTIIRHRDASIEGTKYILELAKNTDCKIIIAHTSTKDEIELIREYKKTKSNIYCEIAPHHLLLNQSHLSTENCFAKVNPPIRTEEDNKGLWEGISDNTVDFIGTDHAPHKLEEKLQDYIKVPSGFPGVETSLGLMLNEVNNGKLTLQKLSELMSKNATRVFHLKNIGEIAEGKIANLVVVDMEKEWTIKATDFYSKAKYTPYEGFKIKGKAITTIFNGEVVNF